MRELIFRPRRLRSTAALRDLVAEARLDARMLVQPHFVVPGKGIGEEISAMPGIEHQSVDRLLETVESDLGLGIRSVLLFGVPEPDDKAPDGRSAFSDAAVVPTAVKALKERFRDDLVVMTDVCLCAYTDHGHCGLIRDGRVDNDATLPQLAMMALAHARAGADVVAPSDMMDGRVGAIRDALDDEGLCQRGDHVVRGEVRLGVLRPVPRGGPLGAGDGRPPFLPDGRAQPPRGVASRRGSTWTRARTS